MVAGVVAWRVIAVLVIIAGDGDSGHGSPNKSLTKPERSTLKTDVLVEVVDF